MPRESSTDRNGASGPETESAARERARQKLESALRSSGDTILLTGPSDSEKLLLLDSIWKRPPKGFAPIPVPCRGAKADEIAETILATIRTVPVSDADGALARMLRTQSIRGAQPLLLLDDLEAASLAALSRLRSIADGSRVEVRWIAAGSESPASEAALEVLPQPVRIVAVDAAPPSRRKPESAMPSPNAPDLPRRPASSEPAATPRVVADPAQRPVPSRAAAVPGLSRTAARPIRTQAMASQRSPSLRVDATSETPRTRPRTPARRRRFLSVRGSRAAAVAIIGCAALVLLVDRAPPLLARARDETAMSAAVAREWFTGAAEAVDELAVWSPREEAPPPPSAVEESPPPTAAVEEPAPPPVAAEASPPPAVSVEPPVAPKPAPPPHAPAIQVGINSDPWSNIAVDGVEFGSTPLSIELAPGPHRFRAEMADGRVVEREIEVAEGRDQVVFR